MARRSRLRVQHAAEASTPAAGGIGTENESSLHAALKAFLEPDPACREVRVGRFIADIANRAGITEIQTRNFYSLRRKLTAFLAAGPVTVAYPVAQEKRVFWVDPETGERTGGRRSPKRAQAAELLRELPALGELVGHYNLSFRIVFLSVDEYRYKNGWDADKKRGATRMDRVIVDVLGEQCITSRADLLSLLPPDLPDGFTSAVLARAGRIPVSSARSALTMLHTLSLVHRTGRDRAGYHYTLDKTVSGNK